MANLQLTGGRVDSRWWYWIAAIPVTFVFWTVTVAWVGVSIWVDPALIPGDGGVLSRSVDISMVALGVPLVVLTVVFPFAVFRDLTAIRRTGTGWQPAVRPSVAAAAAGVAAMALVAVGVSLSPVGTLTWSVVAGFLASVPVAVYYLLRRHEHLGVP